MLPFTKPLSSILIEKFLVNTAARAFYMICSHNFSSCLIFKFMIFHRVIIIRSVILCWMIRDRPFNLNFFQMQLFETPGNMATFLRQWPCVWLSNLAGSKGRVMVGSHSIVQFVCHLHQQIQENKTIEKEEYTSINFQNIIGILMNIIQLQLFSND